MTNLNYQTAQPIKYQLKGISNEVILSRSATDNYTSQSCTLDRDLQITAKITGIKNIKPDESDTEIYGQVWAQVIDRNGRDIPPVQGKDRLFDLKDFQHLNSDMLRTGFYAPPIEAKFIVPKDQITGAKVIVYYVFLDDDVDPNPDDDLTLAHGTTRKWFKNNITYYVHEFDASQGGIKVGQFMDHDGDSGIEVRTTVSSGPIANK